ncbi:thioredoxin domain-containing protein 6-like [Cetorhinus maximus]
MAGRKKEIQIQVEASRVPLLKGFEGKCEPAFIFIVAGKIADFVKGVNAPVISNKIVAFLEREIEFYEKGIERQEIETIQLYDVEDEMEDFMQAAITKQVDKLFTVLVIKPNTIITGNDNIIKEQISEAGFQIMAEEMVHLTEEEAKELYEHKKHQVGVFQKITRWSCHPVPFKYHSCPSFGKLNLENEV